MIVRLLTVIALLVVALARAEESRIALPNIKADRCTALLVGPKASVDGSTMTTHNNDCTDCDYRLVHVEARDYPEGAMRPVFPVRFSYPRYVGSARASPHFSVANLDKNIFDWKESQPIGFIPQVRHTYAYLDGTYGIINEKQVAIGESTCDAKLINKPAHDGGHALFDVSELSRVALERASTAREAIQIMGDLAVKYGYYGAEWSGPRASDESGEALVISDPNEAWHFHVLPDGTDKSAVWAAVRIPDDHVSFCVNFFVIGELDLDNSDYYMASDNVFEVAQRNGFWDPKRGPFNFARAYSSSWLPQHFAHRAWRVLNLVAPSLNLSTDLSHFEYPFSVKPDKLVSVEDVQDVTRDQFQGTQFDLSKGPAAGPYGNPNRYDGSSAAMPVERLRSGHFERAISLHRTIYATVTQCRAWLPDVVGARLWMAQHAPHSSAFVPFYPTGEVAAPYSVGNLYKFSHDAAWWAFASVSNWCERMWMWIFPDVQAAMNEVAQSSAKGAAEAEAQALQVLEKHHGNHKGKVEARKVLTEWSRDNAEAVTQKWWDLFYTLIAKFRDGIRVDNTHSDKFTSVALFYPEWWLETVGYWAEPNRPDPVAAQLAKEQAEIQAEMKLKQEQKVQQHHEKKAEKEEESEEEEHVEVTITKKQHPHAMSAAATVAPVSSSSSGMLFLAFLFGSAATITAMKLTTLVQKRARRAEYQTLP